jgi:Co/Zn/Cd efflux system component
LLKGTTMALLGLWVLAETAWHILVGRVPEPFIMGAIGTMALLANGVVAFLLYRFRDAEANLRSAWICSRNDVLGNLAVLLAALGVFGTGTLWPDVIVATVMACLAIQGSVLVIRQSWGELKQAVQQRYSDLGTRTLASYPLYSRHVERKPVKSSSPIPRQIGASAIGIPQA